MWHWNSLWAPAPGDPPAVDDPALWRSPWSLEQAFALQASTWEAMLSATHSWWSMALSAWPLPAWQPSGVLAPPGAEAPSPNRLELVVSKPRDNSKPAASKRAARPEAREHKHSLQARKH